VKLAIFFFVAIDPFFLAGAGSNFFFKLLEINWFVSSAECHNNATSMATYCSECGSPRAAQPRKIPRFLRREHYLAWYVTLGDDNNL
jgi:hypothetical protein